MTLFTRTLCLLFFLFPATLGALSQVSGSNDCTQTFQNIYSGFGPATGTRTLMELNDGSLLAAGTATFAPPLIPIKTALLTRYSKTGDVLSSKGIWYKDQGTILSAVKHIDGSVFTISNASVGTSYSVAYSKYDPQLNLQWEQIFQPPLAFDCTVDTTGNTYVGSMIGQFNLFQHLCITRFNQDGQIGFRYQYNFNDPFAVYGNPGRLCYFNNRLYVTLELNKYLRWYTLLICINPADGSVDWSHMMAVNGIASDLNAVEQLFPYQGRLCMVNALYRSGGFNGATLIELDAAGNPLDVRRFSVGPQQPFYMRFLPDRDGNLVVSGNAWDYSVAPAGSLRLFMRTNPLFNILNARKWSPPVPSYELDRVASSDGAIYEMGVHDQNIGDFYLRKSDAGGKTGNCPYDTVLVNVESANITYTDLPFTRQAEPITPVSLARIEMPVTVNFIKSDCSDCDTLFIDGPGSFCDTVSRVFRAGRTPGCTNAVSWSVSDPGTAQLTTLTDSTIALRFRKSGKVMLKVTLMGSCRILADSILITAQIPGGFPNLGADTTLCSLPLTLHAQPGYKTYQWQDNSTDSMLQVIGPGKYFVTATDFCGKMVTDTVTLSKGLAAPIALGPDTSLCNHDSIVLDAGNQFVAYQWSTGTNSQAVTLHAAGTYAVAATAANGCISRDTLVIKNIYPLPVVSLDKNPVLCTNNTRVLQPDKPFLSYAWSDGSAGPSLTIQKTGVYWLKVLDEHGCKGTDTVTIAIEKECDSSGISGIWFADAFTPNGDNRNELYKPIVRGTIVTYSFTVYNRFGQLLFSSTDTHQGWDGTVSGKRQDSGSYAWTCSWQFTGQMPQFRKGNLLLIR